MQISGKRASAVIAVLAVFLLLMATAGCSTTHTVHTNAVQELTKEISGLSPSVKRTAVTFTRPDVTIRVEMTKAPVPEETEAILSAAQRFATVDNMNDIAKAVRWKLEISEVHLVYAAIGESPPVERAYTARYFKTSDASDRSSDNIDGYKTWFPPLPENANP